jgi:hypothetical protein
LNALSIILCDDKKPENLQMALTEVARQIGAGETSGMVHGLPWEMKTGVDEDENVTTPNSFTGGYSRHCGKCGMLLQTYCPPPEVDAVPQ